jgi:uncharacterized protein
MTASQDDLTAARLIELLGLQPHPEGGRYAETFRSPAGQGEARQGERAAVTAIYFLLRVGERSHWHKVDAAEIWFWHGGAPLELGIYDEASGAPMQTVRLGMNIAGGERPQGVVPPHAWQAARSLGDWTLVSCAVAPAFEFSGFVMAPPGWAPPT